MKNITLFVVAIALFLFASCNKSDLPGGGGSGGGLNPSYSISSVSPLEGEPGTKLTIKGKGLSRDSLQNIISVNGINAKLIKSSDTALIAVIPETHTAIATIGIVINKVPASKMYQFRLLDVYVTGFVSNGIRTFARLWKNGVSQPIFDNSSAFTRGTRLIHDGKDIYFGTDRGYFKNSMYVQLDTTTDHISHIINTVAVNKGNIYAGRQSGFYVNGKFTSLSYPNYPPGVYVNDIAFNNDTMYLAGADYYGYGTYFSKNGQQVKLNPNNVHGIANAIGFRGTDIYIVGNLSVNFEGAEWKNGQGTSFPNANDIYDIYLNGSDEYLAVKYSEYISYARSTLYLKNSVTIKIPESYRTAFQGYSVTGVGNSVYVAGVRDKDAAYYHDLIPVILDKGTYPSAQANSIMVIPRSEQ